MHTSQYFINQQHPGENPNTYRFAYDKLARLTAGIHDTGDKANKHFSEQGVTYDANSNIKSLTRYAAGNIDEQLAYQYDAGHLSAVNRNSYTYNSCGAMTHDGRNDLDISYNYLNLPAKITKQGQTVATYRYSADGTKVSVQYASGEGLFYMGSMVFKTAPGKNPELETIAFAGGQLVMADTPTGKRRIPQYHIKDHLGSVRAVVENGTLVEKINYYPFGKKWRTDGALSTNDHLFNGKQQQHWTDQAGILDYGARFYDPQIAQWQTQDPMAEKYINISPYTYCANNPIKYIDPTGMVIEGINLIDWYSHRNSISTRRLELIKMLKIFGKVDTVLEQDLRDRINSLDQILGDMQFMEQSTQVFGLRTVNATGEIVLDFDGKIWIQYNGETYNFVHEVRHIGQARTGDIGISKGGTYAQDLYDEADAYRAQHAYDPASVNMIESATAINYASDITADWVSRLTLNGERFYTPESKRHTGLKPVNINSTILDLIWAYPNQAMSLAFLLYTTPLKAIVPIHIIQ